jgi:LysM repeat protein
MFRHLILFALILSLLIAVQPASAQSPGPVYVVQPEDTLSSIAARFNVTLNELMAANNISDPNVLSVGQELVIPGLDGEGCAGHGGYRLWRIAAQRAAAHTDST